MTHATLSPHDDLEIRNLVSRYCLHTDDADADTFMTCWVSPEEFGGYDSGAFGRTSSRSSSRAMRSLTVCLVTPSCCYDRARRFFDPVLEGLRAARWEPADWRWHVER